MEVTNTSQFDDNQFGLMMNQVTREHQARKFVLTANNPLLDPDSFLSQLTTWKNIRYIVFQLEIGEANKTSHYQGYVEFQTLQRVTTLGKRHHMYFAIRRGSLEQAVDYVKKSETAVSGTLREWGEPVKQGQRTDLIAFRDRIKDGIRVIQLLDEYPREMALYPKFYNLCRHTYYNHCENRDKDVILCIGEPRTGKTKYAREISEDYWINPVNCKDWFDGYSGQQVAILDDYGLDGTVYRLVDLLRLTHTWSETVPIKGGFTQWHPEVVCITTNYHPLKWYKLNANYETERIDRWISYIALAKRFTQILYFAKGKEPMVCKDIMSFMLDTDEVFEHQFVPPELIEKWAYDTLCTSEELDRSDEEAYESELNNLIDIKEEKQVQDEIITEPNMGVNNYYDPETLEDYKELQNDNLSNKMEDLKLVEEHYTTEDDFHEDNTHISDYYT